MLLLLLLLLPPLKLLPYVSECRSYGSENTAHNAKAPFIYNCPLNPSGRGCLAH
jgi:hypothetical protein